MAEATTEMSSESKQGFARRLCCSILRLPWVLLEANYRNKVITVEPAVVLFSLGVFMYISLYEQYFYKQFGSDLLENTSFIFPNDSFCLTSDMINNYTSKDSFKIDQTRSNHLLAYVQMATRIPTIITVIMLGSLTDHVGRKIGLLLPPIGACLQGAISVVIIYYDLHPYYFILANFFGGLFGGFSGIFSSSFAYLADVSSPRWRALRIGLMEAGLSYGAALGQGVGGLILQKTNCNYILPMLIYLSCNVAIIVYVTIFVPESLDRKKIVSKSPKEIFKDYIRGFKLFCGGLPPSSTWKAYVAIITDILLTLNVIGALLIVVFFVKAPPFNLKPLEVGYYQAIQFVSEGTANILFVGILAALRLSDIWILSVAMLFNSGCNILRGFAGKTWHLYLIAAFQGIEGTGWTGAHSLLSKLVKPEQIGGMFAILSALETASCLLASVMWPIIFPLTLKHGMRSGMTFIFMGTLAFLTLPLILSLFLFKKDKEIFKGTSKKENTPLLSDSISGKIYTVYTGDFVNIIKV